MRRAGVAAAMVAMVIACGGRTAEPAQRDGGDDALARAIGAREFPRTTSVMALQHGETVYEGYFGGTDAETRHDVRSITKSITALALGVAAGDGILPGVAVPVFPHLADLSPYAHDVAAKQAITVEDLLTMSSSLDCDDNDPASPGNEENMYPQREWARWAAGLPVRTVARDERGRLPFAYCTAGVHLLGRVLERITGQPFDRFVEERLFAPLGLGDVVWNRSPSGEVAAGGQLRLRTRDLARLATLLLDGGRHGEVALVPPTWVDAMMTAHTRPDEDSDPRREMGYGYLMWRRTYATPCGPTEGWFMSGNGGQHAIVLRNLRAVVVVTTVNFNTRGMHDQTTRLVEQHVLPRLRCAR